MINLEVMWNEIVTYGIATEDELRLVVGTCGYTKEVLNKIVYIKTGYKTLEEYKRKEADEEV